VAKKKKKKKKKSSREIEGEIGAVNANHYQQTPPAATACTRCRESKSLFLSFNYFHLIGKWTNNPFYCNNILGFLFIYL